MFGFKKKQPQPKEYRSGKIEREISCIMAVPAAMDLLNGTDEIVDRLKASSQFRLMSCRLDERNNLEAAIYFRGKDYQITFVPEPLELPELYTINHRFTEEGISAMESAESGVTTLMTFGENAMESYLLQLKVICCAIPDIIGLVDFSAERILSGLWARMAAESEVPPAPSYLYSIQAVSGDDADEVWLHTHGLNRCGSVELEILDAGKEHYQQEASVMQTIAGNIVSKGPLEKEMDGFWVCDFPEDEMLVCTWLDWPEAVDRFYPKITLGGRSDREEGHNENTGVLLCYPSGDSYGKRQPAPISVFDKVLSENPLMMITNEETDRMRALAIERFSYFRKGFGGEDVHGIIKFGVLVDEEFRKEDNANKEHLWFEVLAVGENSADCRATQDAYYISGIKEGTPLTMNFDLLTDWILYLPELQITPDSVYLLEQ